MLGVGGAFASGTECNGGLKLLKLGMGDIDIEWETDPGVGRGGRVIFTLPDEDGNRSEGVIKKG